jgi:hypothetical protein
MTEVLMKTWKGAKFCNQACVERRPSNAVRKREKMRNAHISEMRSKLVPNLLQQLETSSANTTCRQLVNRFVTTCAFLRVYTYVYWSRSPRVAIYLWKLNWKSECTDEWWNLWLMPGSSFIVILFQEARGRMSKCSYSAQCISARGTCNFIRNV